MGKRERGTIDRRLGISTARKVRVSVAPGDGPLARYARDYEPTPPEVFEAMLAVAPLPAETATFIDLGAGKGRVLCMAALHPFRAVLGVELFDGLAESARDNLRALDPSVVRARKLHCATGDAGAFAFPSGPKVVFMFNPFGPPVLRRALAGLARQRAGGEEAPTCVLYYEPVHGGLLDLELWLARHVEAPHWACWLSPEAARLAR